MQRLRRGWMTVLRNMRCLQLWDCRNGSPRPLFETDDARSYFATTIYIHSDFIPGRDVNYDVNRGVISTLSDRAQAVLAAIVEDNTLSIAAIMEQTGFPRAAIDRAIRELKEKGIIRRDGTKRNGCWKILSLFDHLEIEEGDVNHEDGVVRDS